MNEKFILLKLTISEAHWLKRLVDIGKENEQNEVIKSKLEKKFKKIEKENIDYIL